MRVRDLDGLGNRRDLGHVSHVGGKGKTKETLDSLRELVLLGTPGHDSEFRTGEGGVDEARYRA